MWDGTSTYTYMYNVISRCHNSRNQCSIVIFRNLDFGFPPPSYFWNYIRGSRITFLSILQGCRSSSYIQSTQRGFSKSPNHVCLAERLADYHRDCTLAVTHDCPRKIKWKTQHPLYVDCMIKKLIIKSVKSCTCIGFSIYYYIGLTISLLITCGRGTVQTLWTNVCWFSDSMCNPPAST